MRLPPLIEHLPSAPELTPEKLWPAFSARPGCAFLDSSLAGATSATHSILACDPWAVLRATPEGARLLHQDGTEETFPQSADPLVLLRTLLHQRACPPVPGLPFLGGAIGWLGYEAGAAWHRVYSKNTDNAPALPSLAFGLYDSAFVYDHVARRATLVAATPADLARLRSVLDDASSGKIPRTANASAPSAVRPTPDLSPAAYAEALARIRDYIAAGDTYQVNFTHRFSAPLHDSAAGIYTRLRTLSPAPHSAYLDFGDHQIVSSTPERLLRVSGRHLETRPIKGTAARHPDDPAADAASRARLLASAKDHAELLMIVDLARNDLGRVASPGTVRVAARHDLETYSTVHHLVATVVGELAPGLDRFDALRALHPGGSITGAPKIRAMQIIAELEPVPRHAYTGALGYLGYDGDADLAIAIRTITCAHGHASYHVGGGITWDSSPIDEYQETLHKGRSMFSALTADAPSSTF